MQFKVTQSDRKFPNTSPRVHRMKLPGVRSGKRRFSNFLHRSYYSLWRQWAAFRLYRCIFLSELRSLVPRTRFRLDKKLDECGVDCGTGYMVLPNGHRVRNIRTRKRIRDIQRMLSKYPWATLVEGHIFLEGWEMGAESSQSEGTKDSCIEQKAQ